MKQLIELLQQIQELAGVGIEALEGALGAEGGAPEEGVPEEGAPPEGPPVEGEEVVEEEVVA